MLARKIKNSLKYIVLLFWLVVSGYPFVFMVITSLKDRPGFFAGSIWSLPETYHFINYVEAFRAGFFRFFINTGFVALGSVAIIVLAGSMASYVITRVEFKYSKVVYALFLAGMMVPIHSTLIPVYIITRNIRLYDSLVGLIGPYVGFGLPISIFILTAFIKDIPYELEEAAVIDGANKAQIFFKIILPIAKPAISTVAIYNLVIYWNEFIYALILLSSPSNWNITLGLWNFQGQYGIDVPMIMTAVSISAIPLIILYLIFQKKVIRGMTAGAVKE